MVHGFRFLTANFLGSLRQALAPHLYNGNITDLPYWIVLKMDDIITVTALHKTEIQ